MGSYYFIIKEEWIPDVDLEYHNSWDWLMPVVEKCYDNGADENEVGDITHALLDCDIDHTYRAVVEFINQLRPRDFKWNYRENYTGESEDKVELGAKKGKRFHHGLIAQEVKEVMENIGVDFGGYQDHKINGGDDVLSLGYTELIAPLIKAVQELSEEVESLKKD